MHGYDALAALRFVLEIQGFARAPALYGHHKFQLAVFFLVLDGHPLRRLAVAADRVDILDFRFGLLPFLFRFVLLPHFDVRASVIGRIRAEKQLSALLTALRFRLIVARDGILRAVHDEDAVYRIVLFPFVVVRARSHKLLVVIQRIGRSPAEQVRAHDVHPEGIAFRGSDRRFRYAAVREQTFHNGKILVERFHLLRVRARGALRPALRRASRFRSGLRRAARGRRQYGPYRRRSVSVK